MFFEEPNEWIGNERATNLKRRDWSVQFCQDLARLAPEWRPACFCVPVGNPPEEQYADWIPVAQALVHYGGAAGYHAYWIPGGMALNGDRDWRWLAGRWTYMDQVWKAAGEEVNWYFGESGVVEGYFYPDTSAAVVASTEQQQLVVAAPDDPYRKIRGREREGRWIPRGAATKAGEDGGTYWLNCGDDAGWRIKAYQGNWALYQADWLEMTRRCRAFGPRCWGPAAFTTGLPWIAWESFKMKDPEWRALRPLMQAFAVG